MASRVEARTTADSEAQHVYHNYSIAIDAAGTIVRERIAPVVMLTAFSQRDLIERARDAGAMA
jgi:AmiR/NasT family two-component response regulator